MRGPAQLLAAGARRGAQLGAAQAAHCRGPRSPVGVKKTLESMPAPRGAAGRVSLHPPGATLPEAQLVHRRGGARRVRPAAACPRRAVPRSAAQRRTSARPRPAARSSQLLHTKKREPERAGPAWMEMLQCSAGCALCKPVPVKVTPSPAATVPTGYTRRQPGARIAARQPDTACQGSRDEAVSPACLSWLPRCCPTLSRAALVMAAALSCTRHQALSPLRRPVSGAGRQLPDALEALPTAREAAASC